jgi:hypothetical protein
MDVTVEVPDPEPEESREIPEAQAFSELSEVHSDRSEEHSEAAEEAAEEATSAAILALEANEEAGNSADAATQAAVAVTLSNAEIADRIDALPALLAAAIAGILNPQLEEEPLIDETGEVVPLTPDEEPMIQKKWHHNFLNGSGGIYRDGTRSIYRGR